MDWVAATKIIFRVAQNLHRGVDGTVKLGHACNNHCLFCAAEWNKRHGDRDTAAVLGEVERILSEDKIDRMVYTGGEPTIRRDLPEILRHVKKLGFDVQHIQTNGRRLGDQSYLESLRDAGLTSCFVSIHGPQPSIHDELTRSTGAFGQTCQGLANLHRLGMRFFTNTVICKQNYRLLSEIVSFIARTFPSVVQIKLTYPRLQGGAADNLSQGIAPVWDVAPFVRAAIDKAAALGANIETEFMPLCLLGPTCDRADNFYRTRVHLSDIHWTDPDYVRPLGKIFYEACEPCDLRNQCFGIDTLHHEAFGENPCFKPVSFADLAHSEAG
ncbi:MAG TPA: radical SAM protein [Desulfomonilaceae bacterium]|nr:radical SAM protein [Desulfomonilaceae bacterium]